VLDEHLSPDRLAEAALTAQVLAPPDFPPWLDRVLPDPQAAAWDPPDFRPDAGIPEPFTWRVCSRPGPGAWTP
jgi:hypothetical protein